MLPLQVRVNQGVMALKEYFAFPKTPELETHNRIVLCHTQDTCRWGWEAYPTAEMQLAYSIALADLAFVYMLL